MLAVDKVVLNKLSPVKETQQAPAPKPVKLFGKRHLQVLLMFLCTLVAYTLRNILSVSIVAMVDSKNANPDFPEYDWNESKKSMVLSSFFWGYFVMQFPGGLLAAHFGPHRLLVVSLSISSLMSILTPAAADWGGYGLVCACRVVLGLCQGVIFPSMHTLLARWTPLSERGRLLTFTYSGAQLGTIISLPVCGLLSTSAAGWPSCFYLFGGIGVAWSVLWFFVGSNSPAQHKTISDEERHFIEDSLDSSEHSTNVSATPWKSIMTSLPILAVVAANCGHSGGFWTLMTEMPTYMKTVLGFDLKANGVLSALPYLSMFLLSFFFSWVSDFVHTKKMLPLTVSRKVFNSIAQWGAAAALLGLSFTTHPAVAIALLTLAVGINGAYYVGFSINQIDLAPNYAGTILGISNGAGNCMALIGPLLVGAIVRDSGSVSQWRTVFFIVAGFYFVCNLIFITCGTAKLQPWNDPSYKKTKEMPLETRTTEKVDLVDKP